MDILHQNGRAMMFQSCYLKKYTENECWELHDTHYRSRCVSQSTIVSTTSARIITGAGSFV